MEEKVSAIIDILKNKYPDPACALHYSYDWQLIGCACFPRSGAFLSGR